MPDASNDVEISGRVRALPKLRVARSSALSVRSRLNGWIRSFVKWWLRSRALAWHRIYFLRYDALCWIAVHKGLLAVIALVLFLVLGAVVSLATQRPVTSYFLANDRLAFLRNVLLALGGVLIGATAIGFSVVMFAVQINFARMPYGLFRKLSSDRQLLGAFAATFLLAFGVAALSLMPGPAWAGPSLVALVWATFLILLLFLSAYRRALALINPLYQLGVLVKDTEKQLRAWVRRARRARSLLECEKTDDAPSALRSTHDVPLLVYLQANPHWTARAQQAVVHAISFARRYAEQGDHEIANAALNAVIAVNAAYVKAKGKTFFSRYLMFDNPLATDRMINETLEQLRQSARIAVTRGDEEEIEQTLRALAGLVVLYMTIDYSNPHSTGKQHAQLAGSYLSAAVQSILPHDMPDVVMEGVRFMGQSAQSFLAASEPNEIVTLAEKIAAVGAVGAARESFRPVTLVSVEQLATLTFNLIRIKHHDIHFAVKELKRNVVLIAKLFLTVPDTPLSSTHSAYLAPYYSLTTAQALGAWLTSLVNEIVKPETDTQAATTVLRNIEQWAEELYRSEKELLLAAIERRSHFTFDMIHWIAHVTKILVFVSGAPACECYVRDKLIKHARWLISVLSWVPHDKDTVGFVETFQMTETVFEVALDAKGRGCDDVFEAARDVLLNWGFRAGRHAIGWQILEHGIYGLAALALWGEVVDDSAWLRGAITAVLGHEDSPDRERCDAAARNVRRRADPLHRSGHWSSRIEHAMGQVSQEKLHLLLNEIADLLSPAAASERVEVTFP
jgi:hypothetical protein